MRLGGRKPGSLTAFVDSSTGETLLEVAADSNGEPKIGFHLFDAAGNLVSDSDGLQTYPDGLRLEANNSELLLLIPTEPEGDIHYRLYNSEGRLLACSDGLRTQIFGGLRLDGAKPVPKQKQH